MPGTGYAHVRRNKYIFTKINRRSIKNGTVVVYKRKAVKMNVKTVVAMERRPYDSRKIIVPEQFFLEFAYAVPRSQENNFDKICLSCVYILCADWSHPFHVFFKHCSRSLGHVTEDFILDFCGCSPGGFCEFLHVCVS